MCVLCTRCPLAMAAACTQAVSTPPPSPPSAAIRILIGGTSTGVVVRGPGVGSAGTSRLRRDGLCLRLARAAEQADQRRGNAPLQPVPRVGILDDVDLRERGAEPRGVGDLAANSAAH